MEMSFQVAIFPLTKLKGVERIQIKHKLHWDWNDYFEYPGQILFCFRTIKF
jgi:hypothetical protein